MDGRGRVGLHSPCGSLLSHLHLALVKAQGLGDACHSLGSRQRFGSGGYQWEETHTQTLKHAHAYTLSGVSL